MAEWQEAATFLHDLKSAVRAGLYHFVPREKNIQGLIDLGLSSVDDAILILLGLSPSDYCSGPEEDRDRPDDPVWIFGTAIDDVEAYIKVKLIEDSRTGIGFRAKILAFHRAERPLQYPLEGDGA